MTTTNIHRPHNTGNTVSLSNYYRHTRSTRYSTHTAHRLHRHPPFFRIYTQPQNIHPNYYPLTMATSYSMIPRPPRSPLFPYTTLPDLPDTLRSNTQPPYSHYSQ